MENKQNVINLTQYLAKNVSDSETFIDILIDNNWLNCEKTIVNNELLDIENVKFYEPVGCEYCDNIGYYERIALFEVLCVDEYLKDMIYLILLLQNYL